MNKSKTHSETQPRTKEEKKIISELYKRGIRTEWQLRQITLGLKIIYDATHQSEE